MLRRCAACTLTARRPAKTASISLDFVEAGVAQAVYLQIEPKLQWLTSGIVTKAEDCLWSSSLSRCRHPSVIVGSKVATVGSRRKVTVGLPSWPGGFGPSSLKCSVPVCGTAATTYCKNGSSKEYPLSTVRKEQRARGTGVAGSNGSTSRRKRNI